MCGSSHPLTGRIMNACPLEDISLRCCPVITDALFDAPLPCVTALGSLVLLLGNVTDAGAH